MLCRADTIGVFQVESRAQMATLPRLRPRTLLRPRGRGRAHPARARSRAGRCTPTSGAATAQEPVTYLHPLLETAWTRRSACRCSRSSSCRWRSTSPGSRPARPTSCARRWARSGRRERDGAAARAAVRRAWPSGASPATVADEICDKLEAFANFGFPESHSVCFAYLVYASSWIKLPLPGRVLRGAAQRAADGLLLAAHARARRPPPRRGGAHARPQRLGWRHAGAAADARSAVRGRSAATRTGGGGPAVRLGIGSVRGIGDDLAERDRRRPALRRRRGPGPPRAGARPAPSSRRWPPPGRCFADVARRPSTGAGRCGRRARRRRSRPDRLPGHGHRACEAPPLPGMDDREEAVADLWATGVSPDGHPTRFVRERARPAWGVVTAAELRRPSRRRPRCWSPAWSPTASGRRPPRASPSSTSRTRPA